MKIMLAALGFKNHDIDYNQRKIISTIINCTNDADLIVFGESFLQGFDSLTWNYEIDKNIAIEQENHYIKEICLAAKMKKTAISFGYFELYNNCIYSSQIVINKNGKIIANYRRVSAGWRMTNTDYHYMEGEHFDSFVLCNHKISIALCGDLWYDNNIDLINKLESDIVLWPVYTDYYSDKWNCSEKLEYAIQAKKVNANVLYTNSYCLDKNEGEIAKGGAAFFADGNIIEEVPSGNENILIIEI